MERCELRFNWEILQYENVTSKAICSEGKMIRIYNLIQLLDYYRGTIVSNTKECMSLMLGMKATHIIYHTRNIESSQRKSFQSSDTFLMSAENFFCWKTNNIDNNHRSGKNADGGKYKFIKLNFWSNKSNTN